MRPTDEQMGWLSGGPEGIARWNAWREENAASSESVDLSNTFMVGADLSNADLRDTDLSGANLTKANLSGADLSGADLSGARLFGANLSGANVFWANLTEANLTEANLTEANLTEANLTKANLHRAGLVGADLSGADLSDADLTWTDLFRSRFIRANMSGTLVNGANIGDIQIHELRSSPVPPDTLRLGTGSDADFLTGEEAANFFVPRAVVEVFVTPRLSHNARAGLNFQEGVVHAARVGESVHLVGWRDQDGGTVLRFQGATYAEVYEVLPDLLAMFTAARATNWPRTLDCIPEVKRSEAEAEAVACFVRKLRGKQRWEFAQKLALVIGEFRTARIVWIGDARRRGTRGVRIEVFADAKELKKIRAEEEEQSKNLQVTLGPGGQLNIFQEGSRMGNTNNTTSTVNAPGAQFGAFAVGGSTATNSGNQTMQVNASPPVDLATAVKDALDALAKAKLPEADHKEAAEAVGKIQAEVEKADPDPSRPGRVRRWLTALTDLCGPAADALKAAGKVIAALGG